VLVYSTGIVSLVLFPLVDIAYFRKIWLWQITRLKQAGVMSVIVRLLKLYPYCAGSSCTVYSDFYSLTVSLHSRDTILTVLLWVNITHYSSLFQYFFWMILCPYSGWKSFFGNNWTASIIRCRVSQYINYHLKSEVAITLYCQLCSACYQPVRIEKYLKSNRVIKVASMKNMENFLLWRGSHHQIDTFCCQQRWIEHKGGHW